MIGVDTLECPITGEQIPAVLVGRWSATVGHVYCPVCSRRVEGSSVWHAVALVSDPMAATAVPDLAGTAAVAETEPHG